MLCQGMVLVATIVVAKLRWPALYIHEIDLKLSYLKSFAPELFFFF